MGRSPIAGLDGLSEKTTDQARTVLRQPTQRDHPPEELVRNYFIAVA